MSAGPIKQWRDGSRSTFSSTPDNARACMLNPKTQRAYCGRRASARIVDSWHLAVCSDCFAAARADGLID